MFFCNFSRRQSIRQRSSTCSRSAVGPIHLGPDTDGMMASKTSLASPEKRSGADMFVGEARARFDDGDRPRKRGNLRARMRNRLAPKWLSHARCALRV